MVDGKYFERICGEFIFILAAFVVYFLIYNSKNYKKTKIILLIYVIILSILSYLFRPFCVIDLTNLQGYLKPYYSYLTWNQMIENMMNTPDFARYFYFYIIAKIGDPNLLQTFVTTIVYSIIFYTIYDYSKLKNYDTKVVAKTVFLFMMFGQYIDLISGIRSTTAFALFYFCVYREFFQKKSILINIPLYLLSFGFHIAVVPAIGIRLLFLIFQKEKIFIKKILNFVIFSLIVIVGFKYGGYILEATSNKANIYLNTSVYTTLNGYIISLMNLVVLIYLFFINNKFLVETKKKVNSNYLKLIVLYFLIVFVFCFEYSIFHRYIILLSMLMLPLISNSFSYIVSKEEKCTKFVFSKTGFTYIVLLFFMSLVSFTLGDMKLLQFFN